MVAQDWHAALHETLRDPSLLLSLLCHPLAGGWRDRSQRTGTSQLFLMKGRVLEAAHTSAFAHWYLAALSCKVQSLLGVGRLALGVGVSNKHLSYAMERAEDEV